MYYLFFPLFRIRDLILIRLVDCGWRDDVRLAIKKIIVEKDGGATVPSVDDILSKIQVKARGMVADTVKKEMVSELEAICVKMDKLAKKS